MSATEWAEALRSWAIPPEILEAAPESPYGFPVELFRHRAEDAHGRPPSPTLAEAAEALPKHGHLLDVGAGGGAASLPLADRAGVITAVDSSAELLSEFLHAAGMSGVQARAVEGSWPEVAPEVDVADVVVCSHVLYNVPDLDPFVVALNDHASRRVVIELTERHPLAWMNDLWLHFHGLTRPDRPSADTAVAALGALGFEVDRCDHFEITSGAFRRREDAIALVRRRLCLSPDADQELASMLGDRLDERDGLWWVGPPEQALTTLWWDRN